MCEQLNLAYKSVLCKTINMSIEYTYEQWKNVMEFRLFSFAQGKYNDTHSCDEVQIEWSYPKICLSEKLFVEQKVNNCSSHILAKNRCFFFIHTNSTRAIRIYSLIEFDCECNLNNKSFADEKKITVKIISICMV